MEFLNSSRDKLVRTLFAIITNKRVLLAIAKIKEMALIRRILAWRNNKITNAALHDYYPSRRVVAYIVYSNGQKRTEMPAIRIMERGINSVIGKKILDFKVNIGGDYSDKGSGENFIGFLLGDETEADLNKKEWLVVTITYAAMHSLLDGQCVMSLESYPTQRQCGKTPLIYYQNNTLSSLVDQASPMIIGGIIKTFELDDHNCRIFIENQNQSHLFEILDSDPRLSLGGAGFNAYKYEMRYRRRKALRNGDKLEEFIIFMEEDGKIYTAEGKNKLVKQI